MIQILTNVVLLVYAFLFFVTRTVIGELAGGMVLKAEYLLGLFLTLVTIYRFLKLNKEDKLHWLKNRTFLFVYFVVRVVGIVLVGISVPLLRTAFFEGVFLLALTELTVDTKFLKKVVFPLFVLYNLALNLANISIYYYTGFADGAPLRHEEFYNTVTKFCFKYPCMMYDNENYMGMITGFSILIVIALIYDKYKSEKESDPDYKLPVWAKAAAAVYLLFSAYCVWFGNSSTSNVAIAIGIGVWILNEKVLKTSGTKIAMMSLVILILLNAGVLGLIKINEDTGMRFPGNAGEDFTNTELALDEKTNHRYSLWKNSYYAASEKNYVLFGAGNLGKEEKARYETAEKYFMEKNGTFEPLNYHHPHNGYFAMLFCTGVMGAIFYGLALLSKMRNAVLLKKGIWYIPVIYVLVLNLSECVTVLQRVCLIMAVVLLLAAQERRSDG